LALGTRLVLLSQLARIVSAVLPLCLGLALAAAPVLLLSGLGLDLFFLLAYLRLPLRALPAPRRRERVTPRGLWLTYRAEIVAAAAGAAAPWIAVGIAALMDGKLGGDPVYIGLLCTLALQLTLFRTAPLPRRDRGIFLATLGWGLVYVGALGASLAAGLLPAWALLLPLLSPALYLRISSGFLS
jgi:hypothetical protein